MKAIYVCFLLLFSVVCANAQFSGSYTSANWDLLVPSPSNGTVNTLGAPGSITVRGSNNSSNTLSGTKTFR